MWPRCWLALFTYVLALVLLVSISLSVWFPLVFPAWVLVISVYMLIGDLRKRPVGEESGQERV